MRLNIVEVETSDERLAHLISLQQAHAEANTPPGSGHAVHVGAAVKSEIRYFLAILDGEAVGCVGLSGLNPEVAEIKTMHVLEARRGEGVAQQLLSALTDFARASGVKELKLETGRSEGFAASRRFYEKEGFRRCERYGSYANDPFSVCMSRKL